jgi:uncharacterized protein
MQLSRFVAAYRDARPGEHVLYDVLGDRYVGVDDAMLAAIERWIGAPPGNDAERENQAALIGAGILVDGAAADRTRLAEHFRRSAENPPGTVHVTWMPTLACNLACSYCFQKDHPAAGTMSAETEARVQEWILARVAESGRKRLLVHYIGGEPLLRKDLLLRTARALSQAMAGRGGSFEWELTTNGVGLEPGLVNEFLQTGPGAIKLTLDGDRETHDSARVHRDGRGTFEEVFASLVAVARACPAVKLRVGGNFLPGQAASYERLLERLEQAGLRGRIEQIRFKPAIDCAATQASCAERGSPPGEADTLVQIGRSVQQRGLAREPLPEVDVAGLCEIHWKHAYTIDPQGYVYRCLAVAGRTEVALGRVGDGPLREDPLVAARAWERYAPCATCCYLPVCAGGCPGGRYLETGRTDEVLCRQEHFQKTFREEIVRRYLAEFYPEESKSAAA